MNTLINRREFLKSLLALPCLSLLSQPPYAIAGPKRWVQDQAAPNVLFIVFDTLAAKHMSIYGYSRETTPHLARFAERATVYHAHYAGGNFTSPGASSLLTGTYPWAHRAFNPTGRVAEDFRDRNLFRAFGGETYYRMAYTQNRLADLLLHQFRSDLDLFLPSYKFHLADGYFFEKLSPDDAEIAFMAEDSLFGVEKNGSLFLSLVNELWRTVYKEATTTAQYPDGVPGILKSFYLLEPTIDGMKNLLTQSAQPFLAYFHLLPPHEPYRPRREFKDCFEADGWTPPGKQAHFFSEGWPEKTLNGKRRRYDEFIAYMDAEVGRLFDFMEQTGLLDSTYVVFTSDHGELFERGIHGHFNSVLYEDLIHIPLLISRPGQRQRQDVYAPTSCVDLLPTLLQATGQAVPDWCEGQVLPAFEGHSANSERSIFAVEAKSNAKQAPLSKATVVLVKDRYKLIQYLGYSGYENEAELYDLANDPDEMENLALSQKSVAAELQNELKEKLHQVNEPYLT